MTEKYKPHAFLTADCIVIASGKIALVKRGNEPFKGMWALPGGFVNEGETFKEAAARELEEEVGLNIKDILKYSSQKDLIQVSPVFDRPDRDPRGRSITMGFMIEINDTLPLKALDDAAESDWFDLNELPELAFDHRDIIFAALKMWKSN